MGYYFHIILGFSLISSAIALFYGVKKARNLPFKYLTILLIFSVLGDSLNTIAYLYFIFFKEYFIQLNVGFHYRLIEFVILMEYFAYVLRLNKRVTRAIEIALLTFLFFVYADYSASTIDATPIRIVNATVFIILSVAFFIRYLKEMKVENPLLDPLFFANSSILFYFSGVIFIVLFYRTLINVDITSGYIAWSFQNLFLISRNVLLILAFFKIHKSHNIEPS